MLVVRTSLDFSFLLYDAYLILLEVVLDLVGPDSDILWIIDKI